MLHSPVSVTHLLAVLVALVTGTLVVYMPKGTRWHRQLGRAYVGSMGVVLLTAFGIYSLFGQFGIIHWGAVASLGCLLVGTTAVMRRPVSARQRRWHYLGMGASVTGLYAAMVVESTYRFFPAAYFWWSTLGPAALVLLVGGVLLHRHYPAWAG